MIETILDSRVSAARVARGRVGDLRVDEGNTASVGREDAAANAHPVTVHLHVADDGHAVVETRDDDAEVARLAVRDDRISHFNLAAESGGEGATAATLVHGTGIDGGAEGATRRPVGHAVVDVGT